MNKPKNYDETQAMGEFHPLAPGGYVCRIMGVEETKNRNGGDMVVISLDIAEGEEKGYYTAQYRGDNRPGKKWGCRVWQNVTDEQGSTSRGFKTFLTSVEQSNPGYTVVWGEGFCDSLKGKLVGGVFGREQYRNLNMEVKWSTKCRFFRSVETIRQGVQPPEDRYLEGEASTGSDVTANIPGQVFTDDDLPF